MNDHLLSLFPFDVFPENKCLGILIPMCLSDSLYLPCVLNYLVSLWRLFLAFTSITDIYLLYPLLLDLDCYLSLLANLYSEFSSPSSYILFTLLRLRFSSRALLSLRSLLSIRDESRPVFSRVYLRSAKDLLVVYAVLPFFIM